MAESKVIATVTRYGNRVKITPKLPGYQEHTIGPGSSTSVGPQTHVAILLSDETLAVSGATNHHPIDELKEQFTYELYDDGHCVQIVPPPC